jgi:hypothetical protein
MGDLLGDEETQKKLLAGEANMKVWRDKVTQAGDSKSGKSESPGFMGPNYDFSNELRTPDEIGVKDDGSVNGIMKAVAGVNYYTDVIGFGESTGMNKMMNGNNLSPMGIRYFMPTGATCSNGALMWSYVDTTPKGNLLGNRIKGAMQNMGLPGMRGLAPGILEDARDALNPMPLFQAAMGSGYPKCKKVTMPVGDAAGNIKSPYDGEVWIKGKIDYNNGPKQTRWIQDRDKDNNPIFMSQIDYENDKKLYYPDGSSIEGFREMALWEKYIETSTMAGILFAGLALGLIAYVHNKSNN